MRLPTFYSSPNTPIFDIRDDARSFAIDILFLYRLMLFSNNTKKVMTRPVPCSCIYLALHLDWGICLPNHSARPDILDKATLLAPPTYFASLYILSRLYIFLLNRRAVYTAALGNDEFDVHYRGVMSWLSLLSNRLFFFYAEYPPELDRLGSLFSHFLRIGVPLYRRVHKKLLSKIGP